jgi:anti-anti-sigma regulatory factor
VLRITVDTEEAAATVLRVAGRLTAETEPELERASRGIAGTLRIDLSGLQYADDEGIQGLHALVDAGAEVTGVSRYIERLLARRDS